jgi:DNA polymerase III gamma/tau subunit
MANGSMRDGLSLLDRLISAGVQPLTADLLQQYLGCPDSEKVYNLISQIGDSDAAETLAAAEDLISTGLSEVQIVDALIDYMRDLMVAKSAGSDSELLILTAEQRKRTSELAEKFDTAALVYNITTLEKLRWSIKNSDAPRALLEALLLRFALSEHFLNVDDLLSQSQGSATPPIKKKLAPESVSPEPSRSEPTPPVPQTTTHEPQATNDVPEVPSIENQVSSHDQRATNNEQRESAIENQESSNEPRTQTSSQRKNEILDDPAVKTVIIGLDATITGIEED